jgi:hypothetical protein
LLSSAQLVRHVPASHTLPFGQSLAEEQVAVAATTQAVPSAVCRQRPGWQSLSATQAALHTRNKQTSEFGHSEA